VLVLAFLFAALLELVVAAGAGREDDEASERCILVEQGVYYWDFWMKVEEEELGKLMLAVDTTSVCVLCLYKGVVDSELSQESL
jgi:hypothetical protein